MKVVEMIQSGNRERTFLMACVLDWQLT